MFLTNQRRKFWRIACNSPNSPKFSPSKILYRTVIMCIGEKYLQKCEIKAIFYYVIFQLVVLVVLGIKEHPVVSLVDI